MHLHVYEALLCACTETKGLFGTYMYLLNAGNTFYLRNLWIATALTHTEQHPAGAVAAYFLWHGYRSMRSNLRALRERIRQVEAGGHRDTPLRRAYNHKLRAYRVLRGGGGLPHAPDMIHGIHFKSLDKHDKDSFTFTFTYESHGVTPPPSRDGSSSGDDPENHGPDSTVRMTRPPSQEHCYCYVKQAQ